MTSAFSIKSLLCSKILQTTVANYFQTKTWSGHWKILRTKWWLGLAGRHWARLVCESCVLHQNMLGCFSHALTKGIALWLHLGTQCCNKKILFEVANSYSNVRIGNVQNPRVVNSILHSNMVWEKNSDIVKRVLHAAFVLHSVTPERKSLWALQILSLVSL